MAENMKVFELAKEFNLKALELIDRVKPLDLKLKNHMAELTADQVDKIRSFLNPTAPAAEEKKKTVVRKKKVDASAAPAANSKVSTVVVKRSVTAASATTPRVDPKAELEAQDASPVTDSPDSVLEEVDSTSAAVTELNSPGLQAETVQASSEPVSAQTPVQEEAAAAPVAPAVPERRGPRYSIIRVASKEAPVVRNLIVEDAPAQSATSKKSAAPKTYSDPEMARSGSALLREAEREEEERKKRLNGGVRRQSPDDQNFKSTDFLRRERVYQPKKKRISIGKTANRTLITTAAAHKRFVDFNSSISVQDLAHAMSLKSHEVVKKLRSLGVDDDGDTDEWDLDLQTTQLIAAEFGFEVRDNTFREEDVLQKTLANSKEKVEGESRAPVVTIMGHVDHGKTSLLDIIRRARVAAGEAGGITQHIGAYTVDVAEAVKNLQSLSGEAEPAKGKKSKSKDKASKETKSSLKGQITFLDTPGHAAFTSMRARGAKVTDLVILVVSAVDGVMPQTREAVDHAKAAGAPILVAVNKMDLPEANPDRIKQQLSELNVTPEEWGGDTMFIPVSAKTGLGVDQLLESILLQSEVLELKARSSGLAEGSVIEAKLDKGRGAVASILVRSGKLEVGQYIVAGVHFGKVRALIDDKGKNAREAGPSIPVEVLGLGGVPDAGDAFNSMPDEKSAKSLAENRALQKRQESGARSMSVDELLSKMAASDLSELALVVKSDVKGSAEAIHAALLKFPTTKVRLKILSTAVGGITESDVLLASASKATIVGFNVRPDGKAQAEAERLGVRVQTYTIIYDLLDDVQKALEGLLAPIQREVIMGRAEVRNVFNLTKSGAVAGCAVIKGKIQRNNMVRLLRDNRVIYSGKLSGLRRFKDEAKEVAEGFECGMSIENYQDVKVGDVIEAYMVESEAARLMDAST